MAILTVELVLFKLGSDAGQLSGCALLMEIGVRLAWGRRDVGGQWKRDSLHMADSSLLMTILRSERRVREPGSKDQALRRGAEEFLSTLPHNQDDDEADEHESR